MERRPASAVRTESRQPVLVSPAYFGVAKAGGAHTRMSQSHDHAGCLITDGQDRAEGLLLSLSLTGAERRFAAEVGEQVVDLVIDAHWQARQRGERCGPASVAAAVAYALALLDEPPPGEGPLC